MCVTNLIIKKDKMKLKAKNIVHVDLEMEKQHNSFKVRGDCEYLDLVKQWIEKEGDGLRYEIRRHMCVALK